MRRTWTMRISIRYANAVVCVCRPLMKGASWIAAVWIHDCIQIRCTPCYVFVSVEYFEYSSVSPSPWCDFLNVWHYSRWTVWWCSSLLAHLLSPHLLLAEWLRLRLVKPPQHLKHPCRRLPLKQWVLSNQNYFSSGQYVVLNFFFYRSSTTWNFLLLRWCF